MQVESIGWEFDVLQANSFDDNYPRLEAVFVGVAPAVAYDAQNQPKFQRTIERRLRDLEKQLRQTHQADLSALGSADLTRNATIIQDLVADYHTQITQQILITGQLELESLTLAGEWPLFWAQTSPLVQQKDHEREPMPFSEPTPTTPQGSQPTSTSTTDDHPDNPYTPV
ncbi:hypothetical protein [Levilactobacillus acidifarinae]|uniref:Uncharacterized protein n=1 Tax=Levilactobacillus acidifarinae DSM 19394 = JCM 15949 TaxID=1423715 RepID=A0A0R1LX08_9LACO|nr:hypothetical protein [Levilactobacillus acidifarinae]KRK96247.1 hypothetical protein FD25_GL002716 [Levilactobacillus acidifarinae DSM 19394]GEO70657.1 hypothetical protein LAC03_25670 [Levilactobacillus acidifarinae]